MNPLKGKVMVLPREQETALLTTIKEKSSVGKIIKANAAGFSDGDEVLFNKHRATTIDMDDEILYIIDAEDIYATITY